MFSRKFTYYWRRRWKSLLLIIVACLILGFTLDNLVNIKNNENAYATLHHPDHRVSSGVSSSNRNHDQFDQNGRRLEEASQQETKKTEDAIADDESTKLERRRQQLISDIALGRAQLQSFVSITELQEQQHNHERQLRKMQQQQSAGSISSNSKQQPQTQSQQSSPSINFEHCSMNTCFNFTKCCNKKSGSNNFKIYIYPVDTAAATPISSTYQKILNSISSSSYFTQDPSQACLFVLSIDTLDRDELSRDYVRNMETRLNQLELWNNGENHVIFNLYAGTWPNYNETELGFTIGKAILAQASISDEQYRPNFDISIPLFHGTHSEKGEDEPMAAVLQNGGVSTIFPDLKKHLISFKGKRYVYGIGSETRNSVYHLHNRKDVIMVTTCKHGKNWKEMQDERCDQDNIEYEKYDYETLLQNSTFCLVPRGRRLGSFRFLEVLRAGCIPVILSNGWRLPFSEVLDWSQAAILIDERNLLQTLEIIRSISHKRIFQLKQQTQILWNQYLASIKKIIDTTFEILRDRVYDYSWRDGSVWNSAPGGLAYELSFADNTNRFPFGSPAFRKNFTAVIYVHALSNNSISISGSSSRTVKVKNAASNHYYNSNVHLLRLVRTIGKSHFVSKIVIVWDSIRPIPKTWPELHIPLTIKRNPVKSVMQRFVSIEEVETDAIFSLDEDTVISTDEIDFAYHVWSSFPDRLIGYSTRSHYWDEANELWRYSSKWTNDYSLVLNGGGSIYHVYYNYLLNTKLPLNVQYLMESFPGCEDILLNLLISQLNHCPPIKLIWKKMDLNTRSQWNSDHFYRQQTCLNELYDIYGTFPFKRSSVRLDPILYRDPVSNLRKKYRQVEV